MPFTPTAVGAIKPRMLQLIGRLGDGWVIPLSAYLSKDEIKASSRPSSGQNTNVSIPNSLYYETNQSTH